MLLVLRLLENGLQEEWVLGEALHRGHQQVAETLPIRSRMRLGPLDERVEEFVGFAPGAHVVVAGLHVETVLPVGGEQVGESVEGVAQPKRVQRGARPDRSLQHVPQMTVPKTAMQSVNVLDVGEKALRLDLREEGERKKESERERERGG